MGHVGCRLWERSWGGSGICQASAGCCLAARGGGGGSCCWVPVGGWGALRSQVSDVLTISNGSKTILVIV